MVGTSEIYSFKHNISSKRHQQLARVASRSKNSLMNLARMKVSTADSAGGEQLPFKEQRKLMDVKHPISRVHG